MRRDRCPVCDALPGTPCVTPQGYRMPRPHDPAAILDWLDEEADEPRIDTDWPGEWEWQVTHRDRDI